MPHLAFNFTVTILHSLHSVHGHQVVSVHSDSHGNNIHSDTNQPHRLVVFSQLALNIAYHLIAHG
jgi:hypothetical protein